MSTAERGNELNTDREDVLAIVRNRQHFMFTGKKGTRPYCMIITPGETHSGYDVDMTLAYPTDGTISDRYLRTYPANSTGQQIRRDMVQFIG